MIREKIPQKEIVIDITGPEGNAFCLMGYAKQYAKQLSYSQEQIGELMEDMRSGDYEHLLEVFDNHFGEYVVLER